MSRIRPGLLAIVAVAAFVAAAAVPPAAHACGNKFMPNQDCCTCVYSLLNKECYIPDCSECFDLPCSFPGSHSQRGGAAKLGAPGVTACLSSEVPAAASAPWEPRQPWHVAVLMLRART